ncbi:hypothetical protein BaRGS_00013867, partial [Batillaria attramentaria]
MPALTGSAVIKYTSLLYTTNPLSDTISEIKENGTHASECPTLPFRCKPFYCVDVPLGV